MKFTEKDETTKMLAAGSDSKQNSAPKKIQSPETVGLKIPETLAIQVLQGSWAFPSSIH